MAGFGKNLGKSLGSIVQNALGKASQGAPAQNSVQEVPLSPFANNRQPGPAQQTPTFDQRINQQINADKPKQRTDLQSSFANWAESGAQREGVLDSERAKPATFNVKDEQGVNSTKFTDIDPSVVREQPRRAGTMFSGYIDGQGGKGATSAVPEGRVALTGQFDNTVGATMKAGKPIVDMAEDWDIGKSTSQNMLANASTLDRSRETNDPVTGLMLDILGFNTNLANARRGGAEENADYEFDFGDKGVYSQDQMNNAVFQYYPAEEGEKPDVLQLGYILDDGTYVRNDEPEVGVYRDARPGETPNIYGENGEPYVIETMVLSDGTERPYAQMLDAVPWYVTPDEMPEGSASDAIAYTAKLTIDDGSGEEPLITDIRQEDFKQDVEGGPLKLNQIGDLGFLNMGKANPSAPWEDIGDFAPWVTDLALGSAPYFVPGYGWASAASRTIPGLMGLDPDTFDPTDYTFEDKDLTNSQMFGEAAAPIVDMTMERALGIAPGMKQARRIKERGSMPARIAITGLEEGAEEVPAAVMEMLAQDGLVNYGKDYVIGENGELIHQDTSLEDRLWNIGANAGEAAGGGAIFGATLGGGMEGYNALLNKYRDRTGKVKYTPSETYSLPPELEKQIDYLSN